LRRAGDSLLFPVACTVACMGTCNSSINAFPDPGKHTEMVDELSRSDPLHCMQRVRSERLFVCHLAGSKGHTNKGLSSVERGLPHPNTLSIQLAPLFIGLRSTGLRGTIKEFVLNAVSTQLDKGVHQ